MRSRYRLMRKKRRSKVMRAVIGLLIACFVLGSSISIVAADQAIQSLLSNWFDQKSEESIAKIDEEISREQEAQTERLKKELNTKILDADEQLKKFTETEAEKAVSELEHYADTLLADLNFDNANAKREAAQELDRIVKEAQNQMAMVSENPGNSDEKTDQSRTGDGEDVPDDAAEKSSDENDNAEH